VVDPGWMMQYDAIVESGRMCQSGPMCKVARCAKWPDVQSGPMCKVARCAKWPDVKLIKFVEKYGKYGKSLVPIILHS